MLNLERTKSFMNFPALYKIEENSISPGILISPLLFVCLCWGLTFQSTIFQSCRDGAIASWVIHQYFWGVKCLAQGHNTAAVGFEPPTSRSGVRHFTTEPPHSSPLLTMKLGSKYNLLNTPAYYRSKEDPMKALGRIDFTKVCPIDHYLLDAVIWKWRS